MLLFYFTCCCCCCRHGLASSYIDFVPMSFVHFLSHSFLSLFICTFAFAFAFAAAQHSKLTVIYHRSREPRECEWERARVKFAISTKCAFNERQRQRGRVWCEGSRQHQPVDTGWHVCKYLCSYFLLAFFFGLNNFVFASVCFCFFFSFLFTCVGSTARLNPLQRV